MNNTARTSSCECYAVAQIHITATAKTECEHTSLVVVFFSLLNDFVSVIDLTICEQKDALLFLALIVW